MNNDLIYGKNPLQRIVGADVDNSKLYLYVADGNKTETIRMPNQHYIVMDKYDIGMNPGRLAGNNDFKYFAKFNDKRSLYDYKEVLRRKGIDFWYAYNPVEAAFIKDGYTMFKGMTLDQVSTLSFDIETTGVKIDGNSFVLLISNTYRDRNGNITRRLFDFSSFNKPADMFTAWAKWVRAMDPDIMLGHNLFGFDFPYLDRASRNVGVKLHLGRDASPLKGDRYTRRFRKDGSQTYEYTNYRVFGREIIDTFFLSIKYDTGRKYPNYKLKDIIAFEGLEKEDRQHWDFSVNKEPWNNVEQWTKFCKYAEHDADDALALYDLMAPQFFYYTQSMPVPFQEIINTATGSQVNKFMLRSYLQNSQAIPKASEKADFEGAISLGNPGIYNNVYKVDVASLYPSIMLEYNVYNSEKDPDRNFLAAVEYFTEERLKNKALAKTDGRYYKDLSDGQKIMINSFYGFMGAPGLNFNYPEGAAEVTRRGRAILTGAIEWAQAKGYPLVNADTDSISYQAPEGTDINKHLAEINALSPKHIVWEDDGQYDAVVVVKAKNYALKTADKVTIKGSALKATMKEPELARFLEDAILDLLNGQIYKIERMYEQLTREIRDGAFNIMKWSSKKTVTDKVLNPQRTNEQRVLDALAGEHVQEGDKVLVFFETPTTLCLAKNYKGVYDKDKMYEKLYKTVKILEPVLDMDEFPNYKLKKNKAALEEL